MVNKVILIGNLGQDPEVRRLENGASVAKFSIATNENYKDKEGNWQTMTEWHDIVAWRNLAERAENTLKKGTPVYVEGKLSTRTWKDKDGNNRRTTEVVANYFRSLARSEGQGSGSFPGATDEPQAVTANTKSTSTSDVQEPEPAADDDLPF